jgi:ankyrin repeat protein
MALQVAPLREEVTALKDRRAASELLAAPLQQLVATLQAAAAAAAVEAEKNRVLHEGLLFAAAESGDKAGVLTLLLLTSLPVDFARTDGYTLLITASERGHVGVVEALVGQGAEVDKARIDGETA